jgi:predicted RNA-binding Zn-ribbon protein involved in translation (DUF1610 family)
MNLYKVWIQIKQVDQGRKQPHSVGPRYEAGEFNSEAEAARFVKNELMIVRPVKLDLQKVCQAGLKFLDSLPATEPTSQKQNRDAFRKMLSDALNRNAPIVDDRCPKCGAGYKERQLVGREFIDIEAIHVHYRCNRCGSRMIEEFKLADVFMDNPPIA